MQHVFAGVCACIQHAWCNARARRHARACACMRAAVWAALAGAAPAPVESVSHLSHSAPRPSFFACTAAYTAAPEAVRIAPPGSHPAAPRPHDATAHFLPGEAASSAAPSMQSAQTPALELGVNLEYQSGCHRSHSRALLVSVAQPFAVHVAARELACGAIALQVWGWGGGCNLAGGAAGRELGGGGRFSGARPSRARVPVDRVLNEKGIKKGNNKYSQGGAVTYTSLAGGHMCCLHSFAHFRRRAAPKVVSACLSRWG